MTPPSYNLLLAFAFSIFVFAAYQTLRLSKKPLPPGPRGNRFSGVQSQLPSKEPWKKYAEWCRLQQSNIISFRVYNRRFVVLNDSKSIHDLLDKRANIYSDRPKAWMFHELCARAKTVFNISSTDERHRIYRKHLQTGLGSRAVETYHPLIEAEASTLLHGLSTNPDGYEAHVRRNAAGVIMKMAYGYTISGSDDFFIKGAEESSKISGWAMAPGRWLVDYFPLRKITSASLMMRHDHSKAGEIWRKRLDALSGLPHAWVKTKMDSGKYEESFTSRLLQREDGAPVSAEEDDIVKWCAGGLYAGAADTTVSATLSFILLMARNPEVQRRAQIEIDTFSGDDRFPRVGVIHRLAYLEAIHKEVMRLAPVGPLALPHKVIVEDEYEGYRIPKDATIFANVWSIMHDERLYPEPDTFCPERFLSSESNPAMQPDPRNFAYGFGRRACPGSHFAETAMLVNMAAVLSKFTITVPPSEEPLPPLEFTTGITSHIKPFPIAITPRRPNI